MNVNVEQFKEFIRKSTLNYSIDSVQVNVEKETDTVWSKMISSARDVTTMLNMNNNGMFEGIKDDFTLNFTSPKTEVKPFIDLIDDESVELELNKNNMVLNKQLKLFFDDPSSISTFSGENIKPEIKERIISTVDVNEEFLKYYYKIKKIGSKFGKIYLTVEDNKLYIESCDKTVTFGNGLKYELKDIESEDLSMCFDYLNFVNLMSVLGDDFSMDLIYITELELGAVNVYNSDNSENYVLRSFKED